MHLRASTNSVRLALLACALFAPAAAVRADLQWYGDPAKGREIFNNLNFEGAERHSPGSGTILPATDPVHGKIWRVHKPALDKRAESRGARFFTDRAGTR